MAGSGKKAKIGLYGWRITLVENDIGLLEEEPSASSSTPSHCFAKRCTGRGLFEMGLFLQQVPQHTPNSKYLKMIDLHTHTLLSDGVLIPSELVRCAEAIGYKAIALTDHVDHSNIDPILSGLVKTAKKINKNWNIIVIPGVEITHVPLESFGGLVKYARAKGALMVVGHGESLAEPVNPGTNRKVIEAGVDILAHPGNISQEDAFLARDKGVYLEITSKKGYSKGNQHVFNIAVETGAGMVLNTDSHAPEDLLTTCMRDEILSGLTNRDGLKAGIIENSKKIVEKLNPLFS